MKRNTPRDTALETQRTFRKAFMKYSEKYDVRLAMVESVPILQSLLRVFLLTKGCGGRKVKSECLMDERAQNSYGPL